MRRTVVTITLHCLQGNDAATADAHDAASAVDEQGAHTVTFVTERRGKGRTAKRKLSDSTPATAQVFMSICTFSFSIQNLLSFTFRYARYIHVLGFVIHFLISNIQTKETPAKEEGRRGSKRRKVSSTEDTQTPVPPEPSTKENPVENGLESGETNPDSKDAPAEPSVKG